jgi:HPt (histidine-containing phosphotransfer) domain-containing protein
VSDTEDDPLFVALRALRGEYLADAPHKIAELWKALRRVQNGEPGAAGELRTLVHRLAGSGGAYGFPVVTERARAAEQLIDRFEARRPADAELAELRTHIQAVADALDQARSTE